MTYKQLERINQILQRRTIPRMRRTPLRNFMQRLHRTVRPLSMRSYHSSHLIPSDLIRSPVPLRARMCEIFYLNCVEFRLINCFATRVSRPIFAKLFHATSHHFTRNERRAATQFAARLRPIGQRTTRRPTSLRLVAAAANWVASRRTGFGGTEVG